MNDSISSDFLRSEEWNLAGILLKETQAAQKVLMLRLKRSIFLPPSLFTFGADDRSKSHCKFWLNTGALSILLAFRFHFFSFVRITLIGKCLKGDSCAYVHERDQSLLSQERKKMMEERNKKRVEAALSSGDDHARTHPSLPSVLPLWVNVIAHQFLEICSVFLFLISKDGNEPKKFRASVFAKFLVETFGKEFLQQGDGVCDVAGGRGGVSFELWNNYGIRSTVLDPRPVSLSKYQRRALHKKGISIKDGTPPNFVSYLSPELWNHPWEGLRDEGPKSEMEFDEEGARLLGEKEDNVRSLIRNCSIIIGMHPDQATEPIVRAASCLSKPFAIVPCCVFSSDFPDRFLPSSDEVSPNGFVTTRDEFIRFLIHVANANADQTLSPCKVEFLPFQGANRVVYRTLLTDATWPQYKLGSCREEKWWFVSHTPPLVDKKKGISGFWKGSEACARYFTSIELLWDQTSIPVNSPVNGAPIDLLQLAWLEARNNKDEHIKRDCNLS